MSGLEAGRSDRAFPALDSVRAVAATAVIATHVGFQTGRSARGPGATVLDHLDFGVALFFVISGFLLFRPHCVGWEDHTARPRARAYLWRRVLRILPAYVVAVAAALLILPANNGADAGVWVRHLLFVQIYGEGHLVNGLTQTWSLCTEVAFYLMLPLLAAFIARSRLSDHPTVILAGLLGLWVVSVGWLIAVYELGDLFAIGGGFWLPGYLGWFGLGMALAVASARGESARLTPSSHWRLFDDVGSAVGACWVIAMAAFLLSTTPLGGPGLTGVPTLGQVITKNILYGVAAAMFVLPLVTPSRQHQIMPSLLSHGSLRWIGAISYGMFLYHLVILELVVDAMDQKLFTGGFAETFLPVWVLTVLVAWLSYTVLERPALRLRTLVPTGIPAASAAVKASRQST